MAKTNLFNECNDLEQIIHNLKTGKEACCIVDKRHSLDDVIEYLQGFLDELKDLNDEIHEKGNTSEMLKKVHDKYSELWLFQVDYYIDSLPKVIGGLWRYPDCDK